MTRNTRKSALANTIVNMEIIVIESDTDTDEDGAGMLALCCVDNAPGDDTLAKKPEMSDVAKTIVKKEIKIESDIDEVGLGMEALCVKMDALGNGSLAKTHKNSAVAKTILKEEIIEIESDTDTDTDEVGGRMLAPCGAENASGDDVLAKNPKSSAVAKTIVNEEIKTESSIDEAGGRLLALGEVNASGGDTLAKNPKKSAVVKTIVKQEIIEIETDTHADEGRMLGLCSAENASGDDVLAKNPKKSAVAKTIVKKEIVEIELATDTDTDEVGGRMLALCGAENASGDDVLAKNPKKSAVAETIVKKEIIEIESATDTDTDEVGGRILALCGEVNASGDDALAKNPKKSAVAETIVKKEIIEIESATDTDTDEFGGRMLSLCGEVNASGGDALAKVDKNNRTNMQIVCADDCDFGLVHDLEYKKYLAHFSEMGNLYMLDDNVRGSSPVRIMYNDDHEVSDRSKSKTLIIKKSRLGRKAKAPMISSVSKRLKTENGRADHNLISRTVLRTQGTQQKRKSYVAKNSIESKLTSYVRDTKQKNEDARLGKTSLAKKDVILKHTRNNESQTIFRASKRLKTENGRSDHNWTSKSIPVVNTKGTQQRKREALRPRKTPVIKHSDEPKSRGHVKDKLFHSFKPGKKESEESLSSIDKSYLYYVAYLRNSITIVKSGRQVKPVKDEASLSDPDIIAVSDYPFPDGSKTPFEATKDGKVIDLEDGVAPDDLFKSSFSKKLMELLRNPYDEKEYLRLYTEASLKRPLTRSRQLRDGREIEYNVDDQLALSYLEKYTDFNKIYHRYLKDLPRALNLLRGFFFYLENIVLEGAFKPWLYEKRLTNLCVDARECIDIVGNK